MSEEQLPQSLLLDIHFFSYLDVVYLVAANEDSNELRGHDFLAVAGIVEDGTTDEVPCFVQEVLVGGVSEDFSVELEVALLPVAEKSPAGHVQACQDWGV